MTEENVNQNKASGFCFRVNIFSCVAPEMDIWECTLHWPPQKRESDVLKTNLEK